MKVFISLSISGCLACMCFSQVNEKDFIKLWTMSTDLHGIQDIGLSRERLAKARLIDPSESEVGLSVHEAAKGALVWAKNEWQGFPEMEVVSVTYNTESISGSFSHYSVRIRLSEATEEFPVGVFETVDVMLDGRPMTRISRIKK